MFAKFNYRWIFLLLLFFLLGWSAAQSQTTEFTYQGRLVDSGQTANANYDFEFRLFDAESGGSEIAVQQRLNVPVTAGIFSVKLDFGENFNGQPRFLEIAVRPVGSSSAFAILTPRQPFTSAPYAIKSLNAETSNNARQLGGVDANQFVTSNDPRMSDERNPAPNSPNYINNTTAPQINSNFNISGSGTLGGTLSANRVNSQNDFSLSGNRVLSVAGTKNLFAGVGAGSSNTTGSRNAFFGDNAGLSNTSGGSNSFFGDDAGRSNTSGGVNSFFGSGAGLSNTTGSFNSFFGILAGPNNTEGSANSFFGEFAGLGNTVGSSNSFFGADAGRNNSTGSTNAFFGVLAGETNTTGSNNTVIGSGANVGRVDLNFATAIGSLSVVTTSNTIQLGRLLGQDQVNVPGQINASRQINASGGIALQNSELRLRSPLDSNHSISYDPSVDGMRFKSFTNFRWVKAQTNTVSMQLVSSGDLTIAGRYLQFSDARYKTNVQTLTGALDSVRRLRGVTFDWKAERNDNPPKQIGFIAQEVEEVLPALVSTDENGDKSVSYPNAVPVLVEAVKQQQAQIEAQYTQNQEQEARITKQDALIAEQQQQIKLQQALITQMKSIICRANPAEKICEEK